MKITNSFFFLIIMALLSSCGGGTNSVEASEQAVETAAKKIAPAVKEVTKEEVDMSAPEVIKKRKEMDAEKEIDPLKGSEYNAPYICVDHCKNSGSAAPGKCRNCKKDYVKNENFVKRKPPGY